MVNDEDSSKDACVSRWVEALVWEAVRWSGGAGRLAGALAVLRQVMKDPGSWSQHGHGKH